MKKRIVGYLSPIFVVALIIFGMQRQRPIPIANAGPDQTIDRSVGYGFLDGSLSTTAGTTCTWRLINPSSQPEEGWIDDPNSFKTSIHVLPYGSGHWDFELTVTDGVTTSKDTMRFNMTWNNPPPIPSGSYFRALTAADTAAVNAQSHGSYPAKPGDYYVDGTNDGINLPAGHKSDVFINGFGGMTFNPGTHVFIKTGVYGVINMNFAGATIKATAANPIVITNIGGQVECTNILLQNAKDVELTGKYVKGYSGDINFQGFDAGYGYQSGTFGLWVNNRWTGLGTACVTFSGVGTDSCHMHDYEFGNGCFAGHFVKEHDVDETHIWTCFRGMEIDHTYGHDTDGEMFYGGDTAGDSTDFFGGVFHWQHTIGIKIHDNIWTRSGNELCQLGDQNGTSQIYNNMFFMGDMRYISPFDESQDQSQQDDYRDNGNKKFNNIVIGAGEYHLNTFLQTKHRNPANGDPPAHTGFSEVYNNLFLMNHGFIDNFGKLADTLNPQTLNIHDNFWGMTTFNANLIFQSTDSRAINTQEVFRAFTLVSNNHVSYNNNTTDLTKTGGFSGTAAPQLDSAGNKKARVLFPNIINTGASQLGLTDSAYANNTFMWVYKIYATHGDEYNIIGCGKATCCGVRQCQTWTYNAGVMVLWLGKIYKSRVGSNTGHMPYLQDSTWWQVQQFFNPRTGQLTFTPPDDLRLVPGDFYQKLGMGVTATSVSYTPKRHHNGRLRGR